MLGIIIIGFILTFFNLDVLVVDGINQLFNTSYNVSVYWLIIFALSILYLLFKKHD